MYGRGYLKPALYDAGYLVKVLYTTAMSPIQYLINYCGLISQWETNTSDGIIIDLIKGYNLIITDIAGTPIPSGQFIPTNYVKMNGVYAEIVSADVNNIWYTAGVPNIVLISDIPNIWNQQNFMNLAETEMLFFDSLLAEGSICIFKALSYLELNEAYQVQTTETSGEFENYNVTEGNYYVVKDGVVIE
jgi:hypothetical protein